VESQFDNRDVTSNLSGLFYMHASFRDLAEDVWAIRLRLEGEDEDEEEEEDESENGGG